MDLKKDLTFFHVFSIATGAMISSGIFILPGIAFSYVGPAVFISYFLAGSFAFIGILSVAELSTAMPKAGGDYYYISRTLGPMVGTVAGFLSWFALSLKSAFAIFGIAEVIYIITGLNLLLTSLVICFIFVILNIVGVKGVAKLEALLVVGLLALMTVYILFGLNSIDKNAFIPFLPENPNTIFITSGFIFISFGGLLNISSIAEEIKNPQKTIPLAMFSSIFVITIIYTVMLIVTVGVLPAERLSGSLSPIADASKEFMGNIGYVTLSVAAIFAFITTALAGIMSASRYPMALSRDNLLPSFIGKVNGKFNTPVTSIICTGIFIGASLFFPLEILVKIASSVVLTSYVLTNLSVIILRESKILSYQPSFKSPFYPLPQIISIFVFTFFIVDLGLAAVEISISMLLFSLGIYFLYGKKRTDQEYALLHILEKIVNTNLTNHSLEAELIEIIKDRDRIGTDEFDDLVKKAIVIDIKERMELEEMIKKIAEELEIVTGEDKEIIYKILMKKEINSTSVVSDFVAIPHVILENFNEFNLLMIRCQEGVYFSDKTPSIKAVFVFVGKKESILFHLKSLASIAYIIQEDEFNSQWMKAKDENYIKDLMLLSRRKRF